MKKINPGILVGTISDNLDPDELGRVKVVVDILGETVTTDWVPILNMQSSTDSGTFFMPEVDARVAVTFIGEGVSTPLVLGGVWGAFQTPPLTEENSDSDLNADGENNLKFIRSRSGQRIIFDDKDGEEKVQIISKDAATRFEFLVADETINIESDKDITIKAGGKLSIEAEEAEITLEGVAGITSAGMAIEASDAVNITSGSGITAEGSAIKLN